jgi:hypothetical protein
MPKKGQHRNDAFDPLRSAGRNNPEKGVTITAGTPKKRETYAEQAREGRNPDPQAQAAKPRRDERTTGPSESGRTRASNPRSGRSGSDSNADAGSRGN